MRKYKISKSDLQAGQENSTPQPEGDRPFDSRVIRNAINVLPQLKTKLEFLALVLYEEEGLVVATPVFVAQAAIVGGRQWKNVQTILSRRIPKRGAERNKQGALLKGVLYCPSCNQPMRHTYTSRNEQRYRYYVCTKGEHGCRNRTAAVRLEASVLERLAEVAQNHAVLGKLVRMCAARNMVSPQLLARLHMWVERVTYSHTTGEVSIQLRTKEAKRHGIG